MAKVPRKIFKKDSKYKLKVRMQEISAVQEYVDVDMDDGSYKRADVSRLLTDDEVKAVQVEKLKRVWPFVPVGLGMAQQNNRRHGLLTAPVANLFLLHGCVSRLNLVGAVK